MMRITHDAKSRSAYIYLSDNAVLVTREITGTVIVDLDADANVVGVELLDVDSPTVEDITGAPTSGEEKG
jgi:uncharacterized protein YuzE